MLIIHNFTNAKINILIINMIFLFRLHPLKYSAKQMELLVGHVGQFRQSKQRLLLPAGSGLQLALLSHSGHVRSTLSSLGGCQQTSN